MRILHHQEIQRKRKAYPDTHTVVIAKDVPKGLDIASLTVEDFKEAGYMVLEDSKSLRAPGHVLMGISEGEYSLHMDAVHAEANKGTALDPEKYDDAGNEIGGIGKVEVSSAVSIDQVMFGENTIVVQERAHKTTKTGGTE